MDIAKKMVEFAENQQVINEKLNGELLDPYDTGYDIGYSEGLTEGLTEGKTAEQNSFWDTYQDNGNRQDYDYAFAGSGWTDELFDPKYPIVANSYVGMFEDNDKITSTKVSLDFSNNTNDENNRCFFNCSSLKTIPSLKVGRPTVFFGSFDRCFSLEFIGFVGELCADVDLGNCPNLNVDTIMQLALIASADMPSTIYLPSELTNKLYEYNYEVADERFPEEYQGWQLIDIFWEKGWNV